MSESEKNKKEMDTTPNSKESQDASDTPLSCLSSNSCLSNNSRSGLTLTRASEKHHLQRLNSRLETYVQRYHFLENELEVLAKSKETEIEKQKKSYERKIQSMKQQIDDLIINLETEEDLRCKIQLSENIARKELDEVKPYYDRYATLEDEATRLRSNLSSLTEKYNKSQDLVKAQAPELMMQTRLVKNLSKELQDCKRDLENERKNSEEYRLQLDELNGFGSQQHDEFRSELYAKFQAEFQKKEAQIKEKYEKEKGSLLDVHRQREASLQDELNSLTSQNICLQEDFTKKSDDYNQCLKILEQNAAQLLRKESDIASYQTQMTEQRKTHHKDMAELKNQLEQLKNEFDALMDEKIHLDSEILQYSCILDTEDVRIQSSTPTNKRRNSMYSPPSMSSANKKPRSSLPLDFSKQPSTSMNPTNENSTIVSNSVNNNISDHEKLQL